MSAASELGRMHRAGTVFPRALVTGAPDPEIESLLINEGRRLVEDLYQIARDEKRQVRRFILRFETEPMHRAEKAEMTVEAYLSPQESLDE